MDQPILFSTGECVLGTVLVARTERGVCAILLGDEPQELERDLRQRFPHDDVCNAYVGLEPLVSEVARFLAAPGTRCLLYTSDAADERSSVDLGGRRIIK